MDNWTDIHLYQESNALKLPGYLLKTFSTTLILLLRLRFRDFSFLCSWKFHRNWVKHKLPKLNEKRGHDIAKNGHNHVDDYYVHKHDAIATHENVFNYFQSFLIDMFFSLSFCITCTPVDMPLCHTAAAMSHVDNRVVPDLLFFKSGRSRILMANPAGAGFFIIATS